MELGHFCVYLIMLLSLSSVFWAFPLACFYLFLVIHFNSLINVLFSIIFPFPCSLSLLSIFRWLYSNSVGTWLIYTNLSLYELFLLSPCQITHHWIQMKQASNFINQQQQLLLLKCNSNSQKSRNCILFFMQEKSWEDLAKQASSLLHLSATWWSARGHCFLFGHFWFYLRPEH